MVVHTMPWYARFAFFPQCNPRISWVVKAWEGVCVCVCVWMWNIWTDVKLLPLFLLVSFLFPICRGWMHGLAVIHQRRHCLSMVIWRRDAFVTYLPTIFICHSNRLSSEPDWRTTWMISLTARFSQSDDFEHFSLFQNAELWVDNFDLVLVLPFVFSYMGFLMNTS